MIRSNASGEALVRDHEFESLVLYKYGLKTFSAFVKVSTELTAEGTIIFADAGLRVHTVIIA